MRGISIVRLVFAFLFATVVVLTPGSSTRGGEIEIVEGIPPGFELVRLTDDPDMQHSVPDINDKSEVGSGKFIPGTEVWDLHLFSNGRIRKISDDDTIQWNPAINNESEMVWYQLDDSADLPEADLMASFAEGPLVSDVMRKG